MGLRDGVGVGVGARVGGFVGGILQHQTSFRKALGLGSTGL